MVEIKLTGFRELEQRLKSLGEQTPQTIGTALYEEANAILADSVNNYVPFDTGTLANSGKVEPPVNDGNGISVTFGFGGPSAPYAIAVHENPRAGKTMGLSPSGQKYLHWARRGEWKYLETPLKLHAPELGEALRTALDRLAQSRSN